MAKNELLETYDEEFKNVVELIKNGEYETADLVLKMELLQSQWELSERLNMIDAGIENIKDELELMNLNS